MYMSLAGHRVRNGDTCLGTKGHRHNHLEHSDRRFQNAYPKSTCCKSKNTGQVAHVKSAGHLAHPPAYPPAYPHAYPPAYRLGHLAHPPAHPPAYAPAYRFGHLAHLGHLAHPPAYPPAYPPHVGHIWGRGLVDLRKVAVRALSAPTAAGAGEMNWSTYSFIVNRKRQQKTNARSQAR